MRQHGIDIEHLLANGPGYWYLSTPFTYFPGGHELAFQNACKIRGELLMRGISCYSPIAETYMVAKVCGLPPGDHDLWMADDLPKMEGARGLIAARMLTWQASKGMAIEIAHFKRASKPIVYLDP